MRTDQANSRNLLPKTAAPPRLTHRGPEMATIEIGGPDMVASRIALGTWAIGGSMWGGSDTRSAFHTIEAAIDHGINLIDTAPAYGFGLAEEVVGRALAPDPSVLVAVNPTVGVDVASTYCYLLSLEEQRDGVTWGVRLLDLQAAGFAPGSIICDGGSGLQAGQDLAMPDTPRRGDVFHVLHEVGPLVTFLDNRAYQTLEACAKLERKQAQRERHKGRRDGSVSQKLRHARLAAATAIALADDVTTLIDWLRRDILAVAGPCHAERRALYDFIVAELRARASLCPHRLNPVCTYLANQRDAVLAFARQLDADLATVAADFQVDPGVVRAVLHVQEMDVRDRRRWPQEAALRQQLRGRFYELNEAVAAVARSTVRASSVVENLNSRLRNYFFLRRHLGPDYLQLLQFFLNHRRFLRSEHPERVDRSPAELLTGQAHAHWLELLGLPDQLGKERTDL